MDELGLGADGSLRRHAARGSVVNAGFLAGLAGLGFLRSIVVAAFLTTTEYGIFGALMTVLLMLTGLRGALISDPYVQQAAPDQERAFQAAFTLSLVADAVLVVLLAGGVLLLALAVGETALIGPGLALVLLVPGLALQAPTLVLYRRMRFARLRLVQAVDPLVAFVVMVGLAVAGAGVWSLVVGMVAGAWCGAAAALVSSPYRLRWRWDPAVARAAVRFAWPSVVGVLAGTGIALGSALVGEAALGLAGVGAIALAAVVAQAVDRVDGVLSQTLYPAICAVRERTDLLLETFVKANRVALLWGAPFGIGLGLFAPLLVRDVIGARWEPAIGLLQAFGLIAAVNQVGFNWGSYFRARGDTRPIAVLSATVFLLSCAVTFPLLALHGLEGMAVGVAVTSAVGLAIRWHYLRRFFGPALRPWSHGARGLAPALLAGAIVLGPRAAGVDLPGGVEVGVYVVVVVAAAWHLERDLLREAVGYLR